MDNTDIEIEVLDRPGLSLGQDERAELQSELRRFGSLCFDPLPDYQVFETSGTALNDKIIVLARKGGEIVGFVSAVVLPIAGMKDPVIHTGLTVIHPTHRKTTLKINLFRALCFQLVSLFPEGVWLSTASRTLTSLGQIATYTIDVFPSPAWDRKHQPSGRPSETHLHIAREISARHRGAMLFPPEAQFDDRGFVFRVPVYRFSGPGTVDGVSDPNYQHRDAALTDFYTALLQGPGDEVLQISYLDPVYLAHFQRERDRLAKQVRSGHYPFFADEANSTYLLEACPSESFVKPIRQRLLALE